MKQILAVQIFYSTVYTSISMCIGLGRLFVGRVLGFSLTMRWMTSPLQDLSMPLDFNLLLQTSSNQVSSLTEYISLHFDTKRQREQVTNLPQSST